MHFFSDGASGWHSDSGKISGGDRVYIARGPLAGLSGVCTRVLHDSRCVLRIDNWQEGVLVTVKAAIIKREATPIGLR